MNTEFNLSGIPDHKMLDVQQEYVGNIAHDIFNKMAAVQDVSGNDILRILSVMGNGQDITNVVSSTIEKYVKSSSTLSISTRINNSGGQRLTKGNNVQVFVRGKYRPLPGVDFRELVKSSINPIKEV